MNDLRLRAEALASALPPLLARARQLAASVQLGEHGRRRPGAGDAFWQYRPARPGDGARSIDWRRSARSDSAFVAEKEAQAAQSVLIWADASAAMSYASRPDLPPKADRARLLALAAALLLTGAGERVGLLGSPGLPPQRGAVQIERLAARLIVPDPADYASPAQGEFPRHARALLLSDFLGPDETLAATGVALRAAAGRGVAGVLVQILDPAEEAFPFAGRTLFRSPSGARQHETAEAAALRDAYISRLAARKEALADLCRETGWQHQLHHTDTAPAAALLHLARALEGRW